MKNLFLLSLFCLFIVSCGDNSQLENQLKTMEKELSDAKSKLSEAEALLSKKDNIGMTHSVFFWLKEDLSEAGELAFLNGVKGLREINTVQSIRIGPPAPTEERGVIDNTFSYALLVDFENVEGEAAYQIDPIHLKFVEEHKNKWTKVIVYDNMNTE